MSGRSSMRIWIWICQDLTCRGTAPRTASHLYIYIWICQISPVGHEPEGAQRPAQHGQGFGPRLGGGQRGELRREQGGGVNRWRGNGLQPFRALGWAAGRAVERRGRGGRGEAQRVGGAGFEEGAHCTLQPYTAPPHTHTLQTPRSPVPHTIPTLPPSSTCAMAAITLFCSGLSCPEAARAEAPPASSTPTGYRAKRPSQRSTERTWRGGGQRRGGGAKGGV